MAPSRSRLLLGVLFFLVCLPALIPRLVHPITRMFLEDFNVYYTAALVARHHGGTLIYEGADNGLDPQLKEAPADGVLVKTARSVGIPRLELYVYPPTLADTLIPLTFLSRPTAGRVWDAFNFLAIALAVVCIADLVGFAAFSWQTGVLLLAAYISTPVQGCLAWGQVSILLLLLWILGVVLFRRGYVPASAATFALATALKLTPLFVIVPMFLWKDWRWLRAFLITLLVVVTATCAINSPAALGDYFAHVVPAMSHGVPSFGNWSITSLSELFWAFRHGVLDTSKVIQHAQAGAQPTAKAMNAFAFAVAFACLFALRNRVSPESRAMSLLMLAPITIVTSPVSWTHAYAVVIPALAIFWVSVFRLQKTWAYTLILALCTAVLTTRSFELAMGFLGRLHLAQKALPLLFPVIGIGSTVALAYLCFRSAREGAPEISRMSAGDTP